MLNVLILDFDGVILESNHIKDEAFEAVFAAYPAHVDAIMAYHRRVKGLIRFDKFRYICENILHCPYTPQMEQAWGGQFSTYVLKAMADCAFVEGSRSFLDFFYKRTALYIVSINPPEDLTYTLNLRGLSHYFKKVYATSRKKEAIDEIMHLEQAKHEDVIFIGDSITDYEAATAAGVPFIGRNSGDFDRAAGFPVFKNLAEIKEHLCQTVKLSP
jgi:phosphoglycolate phosphatase-like HAD superfamily hydrolase